MRYHINGGPYAGGDWTLIHLDKGDKNALEFLQDLLCEAYRIAHPVGGAIMWARQQFQTPMNSAEANELIGMTDIDTHLSYAVEAGIHRQRKLGVVLLEQRCDCGSDFPGFALNEETYKKAHAGESSEALLRAIGGVPWKNRIETAKRAEESRSKAQYN